MKTSKALKNYYFDLGRKTYNQLPKVGRAGNDFRDWSVFVESAGFKTYVKEHKMTEENVEQFRKGFASKENPLKLFPKENWELRANQVS